MRCQPNSVARVVPQSDDAEDRDERPECQQPARAGRSAVQFPETIPPMTPKSAAWI